MARILLGLLLLFFNASAFANSCCGQNPSSFVILSQGQTLSVSSALALIHSEGRVLDNSKEFYIWKNKKRDIQAWQFNVAGTFGERHQLFLNTSLLQGTYQDNYASGTSQNWSDSLIGYSFEILSEYSFSYWKPVIFVSALVNIPTGHSIYDGAQLSEGTDVSGHNQWGTGLGITLRKVIFPFSITLQGKSLKILGKPFESVRVSDFYDSSAGVLINYATPFWKISTNFGLSYNHLSERRIAPVNLTSGSSENTTTLFGLQRPIGAAWNMGMNYSDQTLLGPARNSILNRSVNITLNYNYF